MPDIAGGDHEDAGDVAEKSTAHGDMVEVGS
jgi:hypothetical protein